MTAVLPASETTTPRSEWSAAVDARLWVMVVVALKAGHGRKGSSVIFGGKFVE